jgi:hypothetical protein
VRPLAAWRVSEAASPEPRRRDDGGRHNDPEFGIGCTYSGLIPACATTFAHFAASRAISARNSAEE